MVRLLNASVDKILSVLAASAMVGMMLHVMLHATLRSAFDTPLYGANEIITYWYLPAIVLLGIPAAQVKNQHISVSLLVGTLDQKIQAIFYVFAYLLGAVVSVGFAWFGFQRAKDNMAIRSTAGVTDIVTWPVYFLVPLIFSILAILYIVEILATVRAGAARLDERIQEED
ncbi:TRAP transporter small permease [Nesterenkonia muleiensis]|uniref:TRAP transporter small permease n=1 Tax=Nesterenkonia muleiensis TaxID=2282648 RepID=UPI000E73D6A8|nr:TRAP transporter small permease [Nesterenkonia muleiensis]